MAFPQTPLDVRHELQIGGTWTDVTADTYLRDLITITRGRADEASRPDHSTGKITMNNRLGKYSPRNPYGPNFEKIGRNTPCRISVPAAARYLRLPGDAGARVSTPDAAALDIVGDLDVRVDATLESWDTGLDYIDVVGKWAAEGNLSWRFGLDYGGRPYLVWSVDGTAANAFANWPDDPLPVPPSGRISYRATLDVNDGTGGNVAAFYYSYTPGTAGPWTLLGSFRLTGTTSIFNSTAALDVGDVAGTVASIAPVGKVHAIEVRNGIAGSVVANPVFSTPAAGSASFVDGSGRTWTMAGTAEISDRAYRAHLEVSNWPSKWDVSGKDRYVPIEAAGVLRRLGAGTDPLQSTLRRRIPSGDPLGYWAMEEGSTGTRASSALPGGTAAVMTGVTWAGDSTLPGSNPLPTIGAKANLIAPVPPQPGPVTGWHLEFVYKIDSWPTADTPFMRMAFNSGQVREWQINAVSGGTSGFQYVGSDSGGTQFVGGLTAVPPLGTWTRFKMWAEQAGSNVNITIGWTAIGGTGPLYTASYAGTVGQMTRIYCPWGSSGSGVEGMAFGHLATFTTPGTQIFDNADMGFAGEMAHTRIARLCKEEGVPVVFPAGTGPTAPMGPQLPMAFLDLLGEAADADGGVLFESRSCLRPAYRRRSSFYNQPVALALDFAHDGDVAPPLEPVDDDQAARNDITVSRTNGGSVHLRQLTGRLSVLPPPNGIGPVPGGGTYNVASDDQLQGLAGWARHLGTWDESRYPAISLDLAAGPALINAATAADVGDRLTIANPPPECGGVGDLLDQIGQGYTEALGSYDWDLTWNGTPGGPWLVNVIADPVLGRIDSGASSLNAGITAAATTAQIAVAAGSALWTTDPTKWPFDVRVSGEVWRVTAVVGAASPQTFTIVRAVNGVAKAQQAGAAVHLKQPMTIPL